MTKFLRIFLTAILLLLSGGSLSATKNSVSYDIVKSWTDRNDIYFLYSKKTSLVQYSLSDVDGKISDEKLAFFYKKIDKSSIYDGQIINLEHGISADELIYVDSDFLVSGKTSQVSITNKDSKFHITCNRKIWGNSNAIRFDGILFYCGNIVPLTGNRTSQLPAKLDGQIEQFVAEKITKKNGTQPVVISCIKNGRTLNLVAFDDGGRKRSRLDYLSINIDTLALVGVIELPFDSEYFYTINNRQAYFSNGFVIKNRSYSKLDSATKICGLEKCQSIAWPPSFAYLIVDDLGNSAVFLERENLITAKVKLKLIKHF